MLDLINFLKVLVPLAYLLAACFYGIAFYRRGLGIVRHKTTLLVFALLVHLSLLALLTAEFKHPPITTIYELLLTLGFTLSLAYLFIEFVTKIKNTGFIVVLISTFLVIISVIFLKMDYGFLDVLKSAFIYLHIISALVGYSAFTLSATYGLLYLILYKKIKLKKLDFIYKNIPNLEILEFMLARSIIIGFIALTISIIIGVLYLPRAFPDSSFIDIKLLYAIIVWLTYCAGIFAKKAFGLHGRKMALASVIVLVVIFILMALTNYFSGFHNFN